MDPRSVFNAVLDALVEPIVVTDGEGMLTYANATAAQRFGADKDVGHPVSRYLARLRFHTPDGTALPAALHPITRALAQRQAVIGAELTVEHEAGPSTYVTNTVPLWEGDRLVGTICVFHDVTMAARLERELADHAARLEAIVNLVSEGVFVAAPDGRLLFANAVGEQLFRLPPNASVEERARRLQPMGLDGHAIEPADFPVTRALRGETVTNMEFTVIARGGERRRMRFNAHPLRHQNGIVYAALITCADVTDEVRARVDLESAREAAEEASRLKDQFIAALSHELRTPLQPILGWTEVLRRHGNLDDVTARALEAIRRNIRQQVRLVDDLLDLSRIVHGKLTLRFEAFDLRDQVRAAADAFEEAASLKRVRLTASLPPDPLPMWGDGARMQQVTANLIANGLKFTPAGGQVTVRLSVVGERAVLEVQDSGEGIAAADLPIIFEAFRQGTQSNRRGGLGIGLDLVRRLTELHNGSVRVFSEGSGRGATFRVELPLAPPSVAVPRAAAPGGGRLGARRLLVVEDNTDTREVLKFMLESEGARVETADDGHAAVKAAEMFHPEVVLCDIGLPDIDGLEVARRIRARPELTGTRLIALTGYGQADDVKQAADAGFEAHLTKPVNLDQLMALLTTPTPGAR